MKFLKTLIKIFEGLLWLYLPLVILYWVIMPVEFSFIKALRGFLGIFIEPLLLPLNSNYDFVFKYDNQGLSYSALVLAGLVIVTALLAMASVKLIEIIEENIFQLKIKMSRREIEKEKEKEVQSVQEELNKNKIIYLILKIIKAQEHEEYLVKADDSPFSIGLVDSYQTSIVNLAQKFSGKEYTKFNAGTDIYNFIFTDEERLLQYLKFLRQRINEINKGTAELNTTFSYEVACSCGYSLVTADTDLSVTSKILKLCGDREVLITEVLKNKISRLKDLFDIKIAPKGLYMLDEHQVDIHLLSFN